MSQDKLVIDLNFESSRGHFLRAIQHQLDVVTVLLAGVERVTAEECEPRGFHNFSPAHGAQLNHEEAKIKAVDWLNSSFLRDAIEATDQFLGRCLSFCFAIQVAGTGKATSAELDEVVRLAPQRHHKMHFPVKLQVLEQKYAVKPDFSEHVLSLNKLRTCLVHRLGKITPLDINQDGWLVAKWVSSRMVLRGIQTGAELVLTEEGQGLEEESTLEMHIVQHERAFPLGANIALEPYDIYSTIFTLWRFGLACSAAVEQFAIKSGVPVKRICPSPQK
ncbi:MAG: hypothetical protein EOO15_19740 [Chitinophagaceae bacterium]|nr:MAG: hypothetical protein EOO15_19740 [Chitinophagaceae bacterium]